MKDHPGAPRSTSHHWPRPCHLSVLVMKPARLNLSRPRRQLSCQSHHPWFPQSHPQFQRSHPQHRPQRWWCPQQPRCSRGEHPGMQWWRHQVAPLVQGNLQTVCLGQCVGKFVHLMFNVGAPSMVFLLPPQDDSYWLFERSQCGSQRSNVKSIIYIYPIL